MQAGVSKTPVCVVVAFPGKNPAFFIVNKSSTSPEILIHGKRVKSGEGS
jgi:hypothetical protein